MGKRPTKKIGYALAAAAAFVLTFSAGLPIQAASAQGADRAKPSKLAHADSAQVVDRAKPAKMAHAAGAATGSKPVHKGMYYVDFRARTAASYGHAFVWYGRSDQRAVEVAGLHPATDSVVPYILGHVIPVIAETGASYGDLDEQYLTASYRVYMDDAQAKRVFAQIKHMQATSPLWNAALYNCVAFIQDIARYMGLRVPGTHLIYPETWVNQLRALNGGGKVGYMPGMHREQKPTAHARASTPARAAAHARASAPRRASAPSIQTATALTRPVPIQRPYD
jgi:hypothetical protein